MTVLCARDRIDDVMAPRKTYKYHFKKGNKIVHVGITDDLARREQEHQRRFGESGHISPVGRRTTREAALEWEREQAANGRPTRSTVSKK